MNEKIDESWADFWKNRVFMQYECPAANCSTPQDQQRWMLDSRDAVWYEGWPGWQRHYVLGLFVRSSFSPSERLSVVKLVNLTIHSFLHSFVSHQANEHDILKANELILIQIITNGPLGNSKKRSTFWIRITRCQNWLQKSVSAGYF